MSGDFFRRIANIRADRQEIQTRCRVTTYIRGQVNRISAQHPVSMGVTFFHKFQRATPKNPIGGRPRRGRLNRLPHLAGARRTPYHVSGRFQNEFFLALNSRTDVRVYDNGRCPAAPFIERSRSIAKKLPATVQCSVAGELRLPLVLALGQDGDHNADHHED